METITKRHPIRGFFYGIFFGLGLTLIVVGQGLAALGTWPPFIVLVVGIIVGTLWGTFGPAKGPKGPPPAGATLADEPEPSPGPEPSPEPEPEDAEPGGAPADDAGDPATLAEGPDETAEA